MISGETMNCFKILAMLIIIMSFTFNIASDFITELSLEEFHEIYLTGYVKIGSFFPETDVNTFLCSVAEKTGDIVVLVRGWRRDSLYLYDIYGEMEWQKDLDLEKEYYELEVSEECSVIFIKQQRQSDETFYDNELIIDRNGRIFLDMEISQYDLHLSPDGEYLIPREILYDDEMEEFYIFNKNGKKIRLYPGATRNIQDIELCFSHSDQLLAYILQKGQPGNKLVSFKKESGEFRKDWETYLYNKNIYQGTDRNMQTESTRTVIRTGEDELSFIDNVDGELVNKYQTGIIEWKLKDDNKVYYQEFVIDEKIKPFWQLYLNNTKNIKRELQLNDLPIFGWSDFIDLPGSRLFYSCGAKRYIKDKETVCSWIVSDYEYYELKENFYPVSVEGSDYLIAVEAGFEPVITIFIKE